MRLKLTTIVFSLVILCVSCKKENTLSEYKFSDKPQAINCNDSNSKLVNEALYSFEEDILTYYSKGKPNTSLIQSYNQFIRNAVYGRIKYDDIASEHSKKVFEALKQDNSLWNAKTPNSYLNYNGNLVTCIANNIQDKNLKTTFNALISTNSMSPKLFGTPLTANYRSAIKDKYLAAYIAFDLFYAKLFNIDLSKINSNTPEANKKVSNTDSHAGHNH